jgi:hypothetical protein
MSIKKLLLLTIFFFSVSLFVPNVSKAASLQEALTSENSIIVKIQEGFQYFFTVGVGNKVKVLEKHAERRLAMAQNYAEKGNGERVQNLMQSYLQIKERQGNLLDKNDDKDVLDEVGDRTIEQQKAMEEIKNIIIDDMGKQGVIDVQEQVVNQVAQNIIEINGQEGATEFLNKVEHVWAPGTGQGGEAGVVYEGGSKLMFAPGTSAGGSAVNDIKTVEVKTGGFPNQDVPVNNSGSNWAPGTSQGGTSVNSISPGGVDSGTTSDSKTWIDP